ncbi:uncharacterized protein A4U43_C07F33920 [Asparagus officinalis]|uniref:Uncharacterized protein n=1 Tax=Asparagus officinalis TaxID=4686 RepID=A0A5P1EH07_ASPOF|nr:uncharacterized protein A4U43_C07F33920 [Asparagus officinalis]
MECICSLTLEPKQNYRFLFRAEEAQWQLELAKEQAARRDHKSQYWDGDEAEVEQTHDRTRVAMYRAWLWLAILIAGCHGFDKHKSVGGDSTAKLRSYNESQRQ